MVEKYQQTNKASIAGNELAVEPLLYLAALAKVLEAELVGRNRTLQLVHRICATSTTSSSSGNVRQVSLGWFGKYSFGKIWSTFLFLFVPVYHCSTLPSW